MYEESTFRQQLYYVTFPCFYCWSITVWSQGDSYQEQPVQEIFPALTDHMQRLEYCRSYLNHFTVFSSLLGGWRIMVEEQQHHWRLGAVTLPRRCTKWCRSPVRVLGTVALHKMCWSKSTAACLLVRIIAAFIAFSQRMFRGNLDWLT